MTSAVLHIINDLGNGGAQACCFRLCKSLQRNGVRQQLISLAKESKYSRGLEDNQITVIHLGIYSNPIWGLLRLFHLISKNRDSTICSWLYDANVVSTIAALAALKKYHHVWMMRRLPATRENSSIKAVMAMWVARWLTRFCSIKIVCNTDTAVEAYKQIGFRGSYFVLDNGFEAIEESKIGDKSYNASFSRLSPLKIVMLARFHRVKNHDMLFKALHLVHERYPFLVQAYLAGDGMNEENKELQGMIEKLGLVKIIRLMGPIDGVSELVDQCDLGVQTSISEGFPNSIADIMNTGRPVVATNVGSSANIVGKTGWIIESRNHEMLGRILIEILENNNRHDLRALGQEARRRIRNKYSTRAMGQGFSAIIGL